MRRFIGDASHELRTPLVTVRGYAELYRMGAISDPEQTAQAMERIEKEAIRMGALVEDLKTMMDRLVADGAGYKHDDPRFSDCERGNASSHLRAALLGRSVAVGISGGELSLGRFQSILFAELDGPRPRSIDIQIMGVGPVTGN